MTTIISQQQQQQQQQLTVYEVWRQIRDTYERNARDIVYAYGMARNFTSVDSLYGEATSVKCSLIVVIDPQHHAFDKFLRYANSLMHRHGILLLSLTWLRTDEYSEHDLRMEEIRRFDEHLRTICCESVAVSTDAAAMMAYGDSIETNDFIQENEIGEENKRSSSSPDDDKSQLYDDINVQSSSLRDFVVTNVDNIDDDDDNNDDDYADDENILLQFAMPPGMIVDIEQQRFKDSVLRNHILTHFFGKLLFYCRRIPLCDMLNIIRHKSFRLVHPSTVNRWFRDICIQ